MPFDKKRFIKGQQYSTERDYKLEGAGPKKSSSAMGVGGKQNIFGVLDRAIRKSKAKSNNMVEIPNSPGHNKKPKTKFLEPTKMK